MKYRVEIDIGYMAKITILNLSASHIYTQEPLNISVDKGMLKETAINSLIVTLIIMLTGGLLGIYYFDNIVGGTFLAGMVLFIFLIIRIWYPKIKAA